MTLRGCGYDSDPERIRAGLVVLLVGIVLLLAALGMAVVRGPAPPGDVVTAEGQIESADEAKILPARLVAALIVLGIALLVTLLVASYILIRHTRRHAKGVRMRPARPTPADDVWAMHKLPEQPAEEESPEP